MEDSERCLEEMVEPTLKDFEANPTSRRHAFLACVIAHAVDCLSIRDEPISVGKHSSVARKIFI